MNQKIKFVWKFIFLSKKKISLILINIILKITFKIKIIEISFISFICSRFSITCN